MAISKTIREQVYNKFGGRCAYTGKPLDEKWQVDHIKSKCLFQQILVSPARYKNIRTGNIISVEELNKIIVVNLELFWDYKYLPPTYKPSKECDDIDNLLPTLRIINHYKRSQDLEMFRTYILTLHLRLRKLPEKTTRPSTIKRKKYLLEVAEHFGVSTDKPFDGIFFFEKIKP